MSLRIGDDILAGELRNTRRNGVFGWIEFAPDFGVRIELTGNLGGDLEGKHIRFTTPRSSTNPPDLDELPEHINSLADRQIGVTGEILLRKTKVPTLPIDDFLDLSSDQQQAHLVEKECLHIEWYSQNGRITAEVLEPNIEFIDPSSGADDEQVQIEPLTDGEGMNVGFTEIRLDEESKPLGFEQDDASEDGGVEEVDDPYGLFGEDIEKRLAQSLGEDVGAESSENSNESRSWEDMDLDPETRAMYEQMDEIFEGKRDQPISYLFETPLKLPKPDRVDTDEEAEPLVRSILAQLALLSVALDVCEHFSAVDTYRLLMNEILPTAKVHPNLAASEMVQHYSTSDFCSSCESEFDDDFGEDGPAPDSNDDANDDLPDGPDK